jgi:hypothetical protein
MNKTKAKNVLHWIGFVAVIVAAIYIGVIAKGLGVVERIGLAASALGGLFVALGKVFPSLDKAVDALPDDPPNVVPLPPRDGQAGHAEMPPLLVYVGICTFVGLLALLWLGLNRAIADEPPVTDTVGNWTQAWTAGVSAMSISLRDGATAFGDMAGGCYGITNRVWHLGGDGCVFLRLATKGLPNAFALTLGPHYRNAGISIGAAHAQDSGWAPMLFLTGQAEIAGGL